MTSKPQPELRCIANLDLAIAHASREPQLCLYYLSAQAEHVLNSIVFNRQRGVKN